MKKKILSFTILIIIPLIWGFAFSAQVLGAEHIDTFTFNGIRFGLGALSLIPVIALFEKDFSDKKILKNTVFVGAVIGVLLFLASACQQYGIQLSGNASKAGFITGFYVVLVPVIRAVFGKKTSVSVWIGVVLALAGLYLLSIKENFTIETSDLLYLIGAVIWAVQILIIDKYAKNIYSFKFAFTEFTVCAALNGAVLIFTGATSIDGILKGTVPLLICGFLSVGVAYTLQIFAQRDNDPTVASIAFSAESLFAAIGGAIFLREVLSLRGYIGWGLMFAGIILSQLNFKFKRKPKNDISEVSEKE